MRGVNVGEISQNSATFHNAFELKKLLATCGFEVIYDDPSSLDNYTTVFCRAAALTVRKTGPLRKIIDEIPPHPDGSFGKFGLAGMVFHHPAFRDRTITIIHHGSSRGEGFMFQTDSADPMPKVLVKYSDFIANFPKGPEVLPGEVFAVFSKCAKVTFSDMAQRAIRQIKHHHH